MIRFPMSSAFLRFAGGVAVLGMSLLFSGCGVFDAPCDKHTDSSGNVTTKPGAYPGGASSSIRSSAATLAPAAPKDIRLLMTAGPPGTFPMFKDLPHLSKGKFAVQATVALAGTTGLRVGESSGGIRFSQSQYPTGQVPPTGRMRYVGARYETRINGLTAFVGDLFSGTFGTAVDFPNALQIDLRIEQTDTQFVCSARATPALAGEAGGWTPLYTMDTPPDPAQFALAMGIHQVDKGGVFYFSRILLEGDGIGGVAEQRVIKQLKASIQALEAAKMKLGGAVIDFPALRNDTDAATLATVTAYQHLLDGFIDLTFQDDKGPIEAQKSMVAGAKDLVAVRAAFDLSDPTKAKAQAAKIEKIIAGDRKAMANLLGWKVPAIFAIPKDLLLNTP